MWYLEYQKKGLDDLEGEETYSTAEVSLEIDSIQQEVEAEKVALSIIKDKEWHYKDPCIVWKKNLK